MENLITLLTLFQSYYKEDMEKDSKNDNIYNGLWNRYNIDNKKDK